MRSFRVSSFVSQTQIEEALAKDLQDISVGIAHVFIQHTSASLTINENADPDVRADMEVRLHQPTDHDATVA